MKKLALILSLILLLPVPAPAQTYKITDLTLGDSQVQPVAINARGQITGTAYFPDIGPHAFLYSRGQMINLGGVSSYGNAINARGQVAGTANGHAFLYSEGHMIDLGTLDPAFDGSWGKAINDRGEVTGDSYVGPGNFFEGVYTHPFLYTDGHMTDLGTHASQGVGGGDYGYSIAINNSGQVTGGFGDMFVGGPPVAAPQYTTFLYSRGQMINLGTLGGTLSSPTAINARGEVLGWANVTGDYYAQTFLYTDGHMIGLPLAGAALNDFGEVTGCVWTWSPYPGSYCLGAAVYRRGRIIDLGAGKNSSGSAINDFGQVTGWMSYPGDSAGHAFTWIPGRGIVDLNNAIPHNSGWILHQGTGINNRGQIIGYGTMNGQTHAYLLTPISRYRAFVRPPIRSDDESIFEASRGVIPVKFTLKESDFATCDLPPATIAVIRTGRETAGSIEQRVYSTSANIGSNFRIDLAACQYVYSLSARALGPGFYRVEISIDESVVGDAVFALQ